MKSENLFPARLLGFGFYWAWLFLVGVSPSPVTGLVTYEGVPFEAVELAFRLLAILAIVALARPLASNAGRRILLLACMVLGPVATVSLFMADGAAGIGATALLACVDAATFMLWLCFFGHMKVGETALYVALSYAAGALLCLVVMNMESGAASACAAVLPVLSGCSFLLSNRFYAQQTGSPAMFSEEAAEAGESETVFPYMNRMACALALYALLFGLATSTAVCNGIGGPYTGPYIEAPCCLALGVLLALVSRSPKHAHKLYLAYRFIPLLFALGFAALLFSDDCTFVVASTCIMLAYLTFEITSLNDFCNAVKAGGLSLVRMFGIARLAITGGMLAGWLLGFGSSLLPPGVPPVPFAVALGAVALVAASTLVFTEKEVFAVRGVADERILQENVARANGEAEGYAANVESFGQRWGMSKREMEVLDLLLKGRNTLYISQQLFIATGTAKTHIYNIYRKTDVHTKMELLDLFDTFCFENARDDPSPR